jgi:hypothetical protein
MHIMLKGALCGALLLASSCNPTKNSAQNAVEAGKGGGAGNVSGPLNNVAELKPSECNELGGTIKYDAQCPDLKLSCRVETTSGTRQTCIDELDVAAPQ